MKCINHMDKDAAAVCNHCGKSICSDCLFMDKGQAYCRDCGGAKQGGAKKEERSPVLAAVLSFIIAGLGQFYNGQVGKGIIIFLTSLLVVPWVIGIFDAYNTAKKINRGEIAVKKRTGCLIAFIIGIVVPWVIGIFDAYNTAKKINRGEIAVKKRTGCLIAFIIGIVVSWAFVFFVALLAAIAIPNLLKARMSANDTLAASSLKSISSAFESYALDHEGKYPARNEELGPYLPEGYINKKISGYVFSIYLGDDDYKIEAAPDKCMVSGSKIFTIQKGGILSSKRCEPVNIENQ